jgi:2,4-dienoyl-CoA reductase (NADPH2)
MFFRRYAVMKALFTPIDVGKIKLRNRMVMTAMDLGYTPDGKVTDRLVAFYEERARGGAALIILGGCKIDEYSGAKGMIEISDDRFIPGLKRLTEAIHNHGAYAACQLFHAGRYAHSSEIGRQPMAPSAIASRFTREEPREMTGVDIKYAIENFAKAAERAKRAGFDAVEILGNAGYLMSEFLSSITNKRTDEYGGSFGARMRFGLEVVDAVREAIGKNFTVLIRLAGNDFMPGGNTNKETRLLAAALEKHGIDAFNITGGWHETTVPQVPMDLPRGGFAYLAQGVKQVVSKPVIACNRINDPLVADKLISQGSTDMVGFARGLLADPEMPNKAKEGRLDEITVCMGCNQGCLDNSLRHKVVECMVNPRVSHEIELPLVFNAAKRKKVSVIGGGPGGLFAAKTAALAGHRVTLYERENRLGGQLYYAGALEGRKEFKIFVDALAKQAAITGVDIRTNTDADDILLESEKPDVVIIATGGELLKPDIQGVDGKNVVMAWDVLGNNVYVGQEVVVVGGGATGIETATYIAKIGTIDADTLQFLFINKAEDIDTLWNLSTKGMKKVILIDMLERMGMDIGLSTRWMKLQNLTRYGVETKIKTTAKEITPEGVVVEQDGATSLIRCDTVVLAIGTRSVNTLEEKLKSLVEKVIVIGDAREPRKAYDAIREGFMSARGI